MCSSPRGSTTTRRYAKKTLSRSEYEEYASMVRRSSAIYDRIEKEKAQKRKLIANQHFVPGI
jgi:hypothetical protein